MLFGDVVDHGDRMPLPHLTGRASTVDHGPAVGTGRPWPAVLRLARTCVAHRTTGHAAEMAFFAVLTLVPSTVAVGAALALLRNVVGPGAVTEAENAAVHVVRTLMGPDLAD